MTLDTLSNSSKSAKEALIRATSIPLLTIFLRISKSHEDGPIVATIFVLQKSFINIFKIYIKCNLSNK